MSYTKTNWQDLPNTTTPINANNLNKIENELATLDTALNSYYTKTQVDTKLNKYYNKTQVDTKINNIAAKYISVTKNNQQTLTESSKIMFNETSDKNGSNFTLSNGEVVIGNDVTMIRVSASAFVENVDITAAWKYIVAKLVVTSGSTTTAEIATVFVHAGVGDKFLNPIIPSKIIKVKKGDKISLVLESKMAGKTKAGKHVTWMQVESVYN